MPSDVDVLAKRYGLEEPIASGGMATVWRATDTVLTRTVAVKILHPRLSGDADFVERFRREALAVAGLTHPNIVAIYDTGNDGPDGTEESRHYIVMEYCARGSLQQLVDRAGRLDPDRVIEIGISVCDALEYAHRLGVVHRDIKPANLLLSEDGLLKVGDFGIAKAAFAARDITTTGNILGTVTYISPEQAQGEEPDPRSDLYSLGIVLYQLLLGRPPFEAETQIGTVMKHVQEAPAPPRSIKAGVPKALEAVILTALEKDPARRFPSAAEMQNALARASNGGRTSVMSPVTSAPRAEVPAEPGASSFAAFRWLVPVLLLIAAVIALAVYLPSHLGSHDRSPSARNSPSAPGRGGAPAGNKTLAIAHITAFDPPPGDGSEHQELAGLVTDGNPSTGWHTQTYTSPLQGQKAGVGLVFDLGSSQTVDEVRITSQTPGFSLELRAGDAPGTTANSFGVVKSVAAAASTQNVTFSAQAHRYWLLWITALPGGGAGTAYVNEVKFFGPSG